MINFIRGLFVNPEEKSRMEIKAAREKSTAIYVDIINIEPSRESVKKELSRIQQEIDKFLAENKDCEPDANINRSKKLAFIAFAFLLMPLLEAILAYLPLMWLCSHFGLKYVTETGQRNPIAVAIAIFVGMLIVLVSVISSFRLCEIGKPRSEDSIKQHLWYFLWACIACIPVFFIPVLYIISPDFESLKEKVPFIVMSVFLQTTIFYYANLHLKARGHLKCKKILEKYRTKEEELMAVLNRQILGFAYKFDVELRMVVKTLHSLCADHKRRFNSTPQLSLSQMQVFIYNACFFQYDAFDFTTINGQVYGVSNPWRIPNINDLLLREFFFIYNMLEEIGQGDELKPIADRLRETPKTTEHTEPEEPRQETTETNDDWESTPENNEGNDAKTNVKFGPIWQ